MDLRPGTPEWYFMDTVELLAHRVALFRDLPAPASYLDAEVVALHVRKTVEGVAFAGLSAFEHSAGQAVEKQRTKDPRDVFDFLEKCGFRLPQAHDLIIPDKPTDPPTLALIRKAAPHRDMTLEQLLHAYNVSSEVVHERHPERLTSDRVSAMLTTIHKLALDLAGWLDVHSFYFIDRERRLQSLLVQLRLVGANGFIVPMTKSGDLTPELEARYARYS